MDDIDKALADWKKSQNEPPHWCHVCDEILGESGECACTREAYRDAHPDTPAPTPRPADYRLVLNPVKPALTDSTYDFLGAIFERGDDGDLRHVCHRHFVHRAKSGELAGKTVEIAMTLRVEPLEVLMTVPAATIVAG